MNKQHLLVSIIILSIAITIPGLIMAEKHEKELTPWEKLEKIQVFNDVKVYDEKTVEQEPDRVRRYIIDMKPFREALEKVGVRETVIITIGRGHSKVGTLGTYTPVVETKNGKTVVSFDSIPDTRKITVSSDAPILSTQTDDESKHDAAIFQEANVARGFLLGSQDWIFFKNTKKKIKARLIVRYLYVSR